MSIPAAESWDVVREAALAFRLWRKRHLGWLAGKPQASWGQDVQRENLAASTRSPFASSVPLSDSIPPHGSEVSADRHLR